MRGVLGVVAIAAVIAAVTGCGTTDVSTTTVTTSSASTPPSESKPEPALTVQSARDFVREHYREVNRRDFDAAFSDFSPDTRVQLGPKAAFIDGYDAMRRTSVHGLSIVSRNGHKEVIVSFKLSAVAEDACGDRVDQEYEGTWTVEDRASGLALKDSVIEQLAGDELVSSPSECPAPTPTSAGGGGNGGDQSPNTLSGNCAPGYDPCLDASSPDYDCAGGSGDGPDYTGLVHVSGSDPYGLDSDGDGIGCE